MRRRQPDYRIHKRDLGVLNFNGKRFVVNLRPGVPFNACIEEFKGSLRCWASRNWLDDEAAEFVRNNATPTDNNAFVWNDGVDVPQHRPGDPRWGAMPARTR